LLPGRSFWECGGDRLRRAKLSRYGDQIAELIGLDGLWIGVVLMAGATSWPEIFTHVSAALIEQVRREIGGREGVL
jgi:Ca2+/Na+ antiporter